MGTFLDPGTTSKEEQVLGQAFADLDHWPPLGDGVRPQTFPAGASHHARRGQREQSFSRAPGGRLQRLD